MLFFSPVYKLAKKGRLPEDNPVGENDQVFRKMGASRSLEEPSVSIGGHSSRTSEATSDDEESEKPNNNFRQ